MNQYSDAFRFIMKDAKRDARRLGWIILGLIVAIFAGGILIGMRLG